MSLIFANSLLLIMVLIEVAITHFYKKEEVPWREVIANLNSGHIVLWMFRGLEVAAFHLVLIHFSINLFSTWHIITVWVFGYLAWDFCFYWMHRTHHQVRLLWAVHSVHHEGEHFGLSLGIRNSWYSSLSNFPFVVILALMGLPLEVFITVSSINYFIQFYNHNGLVIRSGFLEKILITPSHHRVHHGENAVYMNKNFGGTFVIWDKLFGTFQPELSSEPVTFGIKGYKLRENIFWTNMMPFNTLFKLGFTSTTVAKTMNISTVKVVAGGLLLYTYLLLYIGYENVWNSTAAWTYFGMVFLGALANGGMSENKRWGVYVWVLCFTALLPVLIFQLHIIQDAFLFLAFVTIAYNILLMRDLLYAAKTI
jgi:sterol desaturase/sphingolipid hydroxylase (fatty acid hydroxylase superfamily)